MVKINNKIICLAIFMMAVSTLSIAAATEIDDEFQLNGNNLTVHGIELNVPDGFKTEDMEIDEKEGTSDVFLNNGDPDDLVLVTIWYDEKYTQLGGASNAKDVTYNGVDGILDSYTLNGKETYRFSYLVGDVKVNLICDNPDVFEKIVLPNG